MRIKGKELQNRYSKTVQLARPDGSCWEFQVSPLRLGFHQILNERGIIPPSVPTKISRDSTGKPIRDNNGLAVMQADQNDTEYLKAVEIYHRHIALLVFWEGLQNDPDVEFETAVPGDQTGWLTFADQLHDELERSGWTAGDLIWVCEQIAEMSNLTNQHFRDAQQDFFSKAGTQQT